eukprot:6191074-Pleurochrysis_carterae.AAC.1
MLPPSVQPLACELRCTMHSLSSSRADHIFDHDSNLPSAQKTSPTYDAKICPPGCYDVVSPQALQILCVRRPTPRGQGGEHRQPL